MFDREIDEFSLHNYELHIKFFLKKLVLPD